MPGRNIYKEYAPESYYHIYNRGVNKERIFLDEEDYSVFLYLLKRYLGDEVERKANYTLHPNFHKAIELVAFCLMENHFHLFIYQQAAESMQHLMKSLSVSYGMYFNKKYKRVGPVFQQRYRAVRITNHSQFLHITRYIHMNPRDYNTYKWSSLPYYLGSHQASWVRPGRVLELFNGISYSAFLAEYKERRDELASLKDELANG